MKTFSKYQDINNITVIQRGKFTDMKFINNIYKDLTRNNYFDHVNSSYTYNDNENILEEYICKNKFIEK